MCKPSQFLLLGHLLVLFKRQPLCPACFYFYANKWWWITNVKSNKLSPDDGAWLRHYSDVQLWSNVEVASTNAQLCTSGSWTERRKHRSYHRLLVHSSNTASYRMCVPAVVRLIANCYVPFTYLLTQCLQCFNTVGWASGRASGLQKLSDEVIWCGYVWSEVQIVCILSSWCHCYPQTQSALASFKFRLVLPFWYQLTQAGGPGKETVKRV